MTRLERTQAHVRARRERVFNWRLALVMGGLFFLALAVMFHLPYLSFLVLAILVPSFTGLWVLSRRLHHFMIRLEARHRMEQRFIAREAGQAPTPVIHEPVLSRQPREHDLDLAGSFSILERVSECFSREAQAQLRADLNANGVPARTRATTQRHWLTMTKRVGPWRRFLIEGQVEVTQSPGVWTWREIQTELAIPFFEQKQRSWLLALISVNLGYWIFGTLEMTHQMDAGLSLPLLILFWMGTLTLLTRSGSGYAHALAVQTRLRSMVVISRAAGHALESTDLRADFPVLSGGVVPQAAQGLARATSFLSVAAHPLVFLFLNALLPWTLTAAYFAERARTKLQGVVDEGAAELQRLEKLASYALLASRENVCAAEIVEARVVHAKNLRHPLLPVQRAVGTDLQWSEETRVMILTGSNMAGKSTFLRSLAINFQLAQMGAPVFAQSWTSFAGQLLSSIRTTDALGDGASYFYSEVQRIKAILEHAAGGEPLLYVIDEMFRGTNTRERIAGCQQIIAKLTQYPRALGVIATHDLELAENAAARGLLNAHFREDVQDEKMHFTYHLEDGICPTTNALRVMRAFGLPITLPS